MKKYFRLFLALTMMVGLFTACGRENAAKSSEDQADKLNIVTTIFPEYDWVREILGDNAEKDCRYCGAEYGWKRPDDFDYGFYAEHCCR